ncbi:MAG: glucans biosynthesis glucosyltransferase MdoH [Hyphomicrobiales bacterium]
MSVTDKTLNTADLRIGLFSARVTFVALTGLLSLAILGSFAHSLMQWTLVAVVALPLVLVNAIWISGGAVTALLGLIQPRTDRKTPPVDWSPTGRTAVLITLCGEDPGPVADAARQLVLDLDRQNLPQEATRIFVLSDTYDIDAIEREARAFGDLIGCGGVAYRRRTHNAGRKPGNIADWLQADGSAYDYMMVFDADSRMSARRARQLIWQLETRPHTGLIQAGIALIPGRSGFGRHQRTSSRLLSSNFGKGFAAWSGRSGNYWGHNAIMRIAAFRAAAELPCLSGRAPFGGDLLSHDFVEAAWIRRAGWSVELDPDLAGSAEDAPQTLEAFHRRDRRWCQGNLQHLRLLAEPGLHPVSRFHLVSGIFSYLAAPIWLILVGFISSGALALSGALPLALVASVLLLPKFCALADWLMRSTTLRRRSVVVRAWVAELGLSSLLAPLIMVRQAASVGSVLLGIDCGWKAGRLRRWRLPRGSVEAAVGFGFVALAIVMGNAAAFWLAPVVLPLLSAPLVIRALDAGA